MSLHAVIVGAGIIGCACAYELAAAGVRVTVLERDAVGRGASWASAGVLAPYIEGHASPALRALGRRSLALYDEWLQGLQRIATAGPEYSRRGTLEVALDDVTAAQLRRTAAVCAEDDVEARWLEGSALHECEPALTPNACGALHVPSQGFVAAADLTAALARAATRLGARFILGTSVRSIGNGPGGPLLQTTAGELSADRVVLSAGAWTSAVEIEGITSTVPVSPVRGQLLHLALPDGQALRYVLWGSRCYLVPWSGGRVLVGATVEQVGFDTRVTAGGVRELLTAASELVPQLSEASLLEGRAGLRPAGGDELPIIGRSQVVDGLVYATAHHRNGVLLAPLTAALVKGLLFGDDSDVAAPLLTPARFARA